MDRPGDRFGPYRLLRPIGSGGAGRVFAAVHQHMGQEVALKILAPDAADDPQLVARFVQESRALAQLRHPGIVRVHHCDKLEDGTAYLVMEYLEGTTLRAWMQRQDGPAPLDAALSICRQLAGAMVEVHAKGIVHRDLKPENVVLVADGASPLGLQPKILDFGIAKVPPPASEERADTHVQTAGDEDSKALYSNHAARVVDVASPGGSTRDGSGEPVSAEHGEPWGACRFIGSWSSMGPVLACASASCDQAHCRRSRRGPPHELHRNPRGHCQRRRRHRTHPS